jgi:tRNA pseudouridine38-40 synthase
MKLALGVEYNGARYRGWQRQPTEITVQGELERAISHIAHHPVAISCAGRTDAGVHATGQVVHFETTAERALSAWTLGVNAQLPADISVGWVQAVAPDFHARFSATARRYRYLIYNHRLRPGLFGEGVSHYPEPLDAGRMDAGAQYLIGEHDFSSFRGAHCQSHTPWRELQWIKVTRQGDYVLVEVQANAFLHHMVRNIVGVLLEVGAARRPPEWVAEVLAAQQRSMAATTAKPHGLYLVDVVYPAQYGLPASKLGPLWLL